MQCYKRQNLKDIETETRNDNDWHSYKNVDDCHNLIVRTIHECVRVKGTHY